MCKQFAFKSNSQVSVQQLSDKELPHVVGVIEIPIDEFISGYEKSIEDVKEKRSGQGDNKKSEQGETKNSEQIKNSSPPKSQHESAPYVRSS